MRKITESTLIPISLVITLLGGVVWLTSIYSQGQANASAIVELKSSNEDYLKTVQSIDRRLSNIEGFLEQDGK